MRATCKVCGALAQARQLCATHYGRWRRNGDPLVGAGREVWDLDRQRKRLFHNAKRRAKLKGLIFTLHADDVVIPVHCPVLGIPLSPGISHFVDSSPSIDRIDPRQGYVPGNVRVISWRANRIKNDATAAELELILRYVQS